MINLELTDEQANALSALLRNVGGHPDTTRRGLLDDALNFLRAAGVPEAQFGSKHPDLEGFIIFQER